MFREEYIKANEQIRPDDAFLERLKENVKQEDKIVHMGSYIDYDNSETFEVIGERKDDVTNGTTIKKKKQITWKKMVAIAACFVLVCTVAYTAGKVDLFGDGQVLQAGMESLVDDMEETDVDENSMVDIECQKLYIEVHDLFASGNVIIYEVDGFPENDNGVKKIQESVNEQGKLSPAQRDEMVGNIVSDKYTLCDSCETFSETKYYVAEFENDSYVYFAIDSGQYIFIKEVSGLQSLAFIRN